ncbi:MAG: ComF family protein [Patescibacteria group bacterium]
MNTRERAWEYLCTQIGSLLFPSYCVGCHTPHTLLCHACAGVLFAPPSKCLLCARPVLGGICRDCAKKSAITHIDAYAPYRHPLARALVTGTKYHYEHALARPIGTLLATLLTDVPANSLFVPIPLHRKKLRERGFNQSHLIARSIAAELHIPIEETDSLYRTRYTPPQARTTSRKERRAHLASAFALQNTTVLTGKHLILVDDVITSGATAREAARTLVRAAPASIRVLAFAYG